MQKIYKVKVEWQICGDFDNLNFFFSSKEKAEQFRDQFKKDYANQTNEQVYKKYKLNSKNCENLFNAEQVFVEVEEELMDEEF